MFRSPFPALVFFAPFVFFPAVQGAQQPATQQPGAITGQVLCNDTQRPARLASVELIRVPTATDVERSTERRNFSTAAPVAQTGETGLDGSYALANVKPGSYYVVVDMPGYLLPLGGFSIKELAEPTPVTQARIAASVRSITVNPGQTLRNDIVLDRGASLSGTITYDDGAAASGVAIQPLVKDSTGKWTAVDTSRYRSSFGFSQTDDYGRYRITGLPAGDYAIQANFSLMDHQISSGPMPNDPKISVTFNVSKTVFSLPLYSGSVLRKSDAKAYQLKPGESQDGADLIFPLAKLHKVSGEVLAKDGHSINGGTVKVLYTDDRSELTEAPILNDGSGFQLYFVPEGEYLLQVTGAADVTRVQPSNSGGYRPRFRDEPDTLKSYGTSEEPLVVQGDTAQIIATVPDLSQPTTGSQ